MKATTAFLLLAALSMTAAPALAVHGEAYDAYGVATQASTAGTVETRLVHVHWTGYNCWTGCAYPPNYFVVTMKDLDGNPVGTDAFPGTYVAAGPDFYVFEALLYKAQATDSGGASHFSILGVQAQQVAGGGPNKAVMLYTGNWWDWQLQLVVPAGLAPF